MEYVLLSNTNCMVSRTALSIDSLENYPTEEGVSLIRKAYEGGINFYQISNDNKHLKEILGYSFYGMRKEVFIAVASCALDTISLQQEIISTLDTLNSTYIDIFSLHNDNFVPTKNTKDGLYTALLSAKADENIKSIGFSTSKLKLAEEALQSKLYNVIFLEFPLENSKLQDIINFFEKCKKQEVGLIIKHKTPISEEVDFSLIFGFLRKSENLIPMWKIKNQEDLQQVLYFESNPPEFTDKDLEEIEKKQDSN